ncbi:MAG TPA: carbohydrate ABC transporter permease [Acidimicrobiales bacterium]|nr:carbohydrate ABC transporter permease [Acidimicrobiales bacterium]
MTTTPPPPQSVLDVDERDELQISAEDLQKGALPPTTVAGRIVAFLGSWVGRITVFFLVIVWTVPTLGLLISSLRPRNDVNTSGWWTIVSDPSFTLENYRQVLQSSGATPGMWNYFLNSVAITIPATIIPIGLAAFAAYAFAWMDFKGRDWMFIGVVALMVVPLQMALIPVLGAYSNGISIFGVQVVPDMNITGTWLGVWLAHTAFGLPLAVFLLRNYIGSLPKDLFEAARIDGAGHFTTFWRLVLPLSVPALAAFAIFQFLWVWNDYLVAVTFLGGLNPDVSPMTVRLADLVGSRGEDQHLLTAGAFVTMIVPLIVFFSLQRYFVRGLLAGSVKGGRSPRPVGSRSSRPGPDGCGGLTRPRRAEQRIVRTDEEVGVRAVAVHDSSSDADDA